jgi:hypothetical protein
MNSANARIDQGLQVVKMSDTPLQERITTRPEEPREHEMSRPKRAADGV